MSTLKIYQLKEGEENRYRRWLDYNGLRKMREVPQLRNYKQVYSKHLLDDPTPEQVFQRFNHSRPADFTGHSLSISDIIAYQSDSGTIAYYVDNGGFLRLPELEWELAAVNVSEQAQNDSQEEGYKLFYGGSGGQDCAAHDFQEKTGWNMAWGSDSSGLNGDTWIIYRNINDLPQSLQHLVPSLEHEVKNIVSSNEIIGFLRYLDSGETVDYTDPDAYIAAYKEGLYYCGPNTVRAATLTKDLGVHYEIEKLRVGEFGERVPDKETWIRQHSDPVKNFCAEQSRQEPESEEPEL